MIQRIEIFNRHFDLSISLFKRIALLVFFALLMLSGALHGHAEERAFDEYQVKAVFLYRLTLFVNWPEKTLSNANQSFVIGVLGDDPFGVHIDQVVKNENFNGRPILVRRYLTIEEAISAPCQVLFINRAFKQKWRHMKKTIETIPTLTVSDMDEFCELGGMINIRTQINKIKIEVNPDETRRAGLKISSKLLKVSRNVETTRQGGRR